MVHMNGGIFFYTESLHIFPLQAHYNPDSITNILAIKYATNVPVSRITTDTSKVISIFVTL